MIPAILNHASRIPTGDGVVLLSPELQGRVFAAMGGELLHRLDVPLAKHPSDGFNNLGGNSLWPAPEGGSFAFNYPSDGGPWHVQDGINKAVSGLLPDGRGMRKVIPLENRKGVTAELIHRRQVFPGDAAWGRRYGLKTLVYRALDSFDLVQPLPAEDFLVSAWSLEQFDLTPGAFAIGTADAIPGAINCDFYGDPGKKLVRKGESFRLTFSGKNRLQIGISERSNPGFIGAVVPEKDLLILRRIRRVEAGVRINFADNEQPNGVYSADDVYSVFYGPDAKFFEVETLAPVRIANGFTTGSVMETETHFYRGNKQQIMDLLTERFNFNTEVWK